MGMDDREQALREARMLSLVELAERVIRGEYTPGIEDDVLLDRLKKL